MALVKLEARGCFLGGRSVCSPLLGFPLALRLLAFGHLPTVSVGGRDGQLEGVEVVAVDFFDGRPV